MQVGANTKFRKTTRKHDIKWHILAPYWPNENPAEATIREIKKKCFRLKTKKNIPSRLCGYGIDYVSEIGNVMANFSRHSKGRTPLEHIKGETPDISKYMDFGVLQLGCLPTECGGRTS